MIKLTNVTKIYKTGVRALNDVNLTIEPGEFVYVIGTTGAGKSTFIKLLYREEKPTSGKVEVVGQDVSKIKKARKKFISFTKKIWITEVTGIIPEAGYTFDYKNLTVTIVKADQFMTHEIRVEVHPQKENIED